MFRTVNFLMSGDAHAPYLVVALRTLRQHYQGPVIVHAYPESMDTVTRIVKDSRLGINGRLWEPVYRGKNGQFANKIVMMQRLPSDFGLYLDADIIVRNSIDPLLEFAESSGFAATQFCDWETNKGTIRKRIGGLIDREGVDQAAVKLLMEKPFASVNGGVFACHRESPILSLWFNATMAVRDMFIADETVLHTLSIDSRVKVVSGGKWNCSPKYIPSGLDKSEVVIWHGHGDSFTRPDKSQFGYDLWWPEYQKCLDENTGNIRDWIKSAVEKNRFLKALETK